MTEAPKKIWAADQEFAEGIEGPWHVDKSVYGGELYHHDAEVQRLVAEARAEAFEEVKAAFTTHPWSWNKHEIHTKLSALSDAPPRQWIANCCICKRIVDTREEADGGDPHGCELQDGQWVCSGDCWDTAIGDAPRQVTPQEAAKVLLEAYDARMRGGEVSEAQREMASSVGIAACFGAAAYDAAQVSGADVSALARAFLTALIDEAHPDLDYLRTDPKAGQVARDARAALRALANGGDSDE